jgi:glucan phosphorylase
MIYMAHTVIQVGHWHEDQFGELGGNQAPMLERIKDKFKEEAREFLDAQTKEEQAEEIADCVISLMAFAYRASIHFEDAIARKFAIISDPNRDQPARDAERAEHRNAVSLD